MSEAAPGADLDAWEAILDDSSYYELLGVLELADRAAIQAAFHELALAFHPDQHPGASPGEIARIRTVFQRLAEAYRVLSDAELRSSYDLALAQGQLRLDRPGGPGPRRSGPGDGGPRSLEALCRTPAARLLAARAERLIAEGKLDAARRALQEALAQDGYDNTALEDRIDALDLARFASGD